MCVCTHVIGGGGVSVSKTHTYGRGVYVNFPLTDQQTERKNIIIALKKAGPDGIAICTNSPTAQDVFRSIPPTYSITSTEVAKALKPDPFHSTALIPEWKESGLRD